MSTINQTSLDVSVLDFGAVGDGVADDTAAIRAALTSGAKRVTIPSGVFSIRNVLEPAENQHLVINGTIRLADSPIQPLTADVAVGDSEIHVTDSSAFGLGEWVSLHDDRLPIQGGGRKTRRQSAGNARIVSISGNTLKLDRASARRYLREANAVVGRQHSAIWISHSGVRISGGGIIDGNKANHLNAAPAYLEEEHSEDWRAASGIVACRPCKQTSTLSHREDLSADPETASGEGLFLSDIVIEDITVCDTTLMGICLANVERSSIRNTTCLRAHDKNITLYRCRDFQIIGNTACDSEWEDGIMLHQVREPNVASHRIMIQGNICKNNARFGIHTGANIREVYLANNLCVENGLNLSIYSDNCTSTGDVAIGTTDRLFTADVYRPNVLVAGHHNSIVNLTALATRFVGLELGGYHLSVTGGIIGQMAAPLPDSENGGIRVEEGHWGAGSGEFWVRGDCRIGIALVPEFQSLPTQVRVTGVQVHGCRVGVKVCDEATGVYLSGNDLTQNQIPTEIGAAALQEVRVL